MENSTSASKKQRLSIDPSGNEESKITITMDELNGEYVLQHLMPNVCQYLNMYDLCHVAQVCKSWNTEVKRELDKRHHHHFMVLPYLHSKELNDPSFHVSKILKNEPKVTFLFPGTNHDVDDIEEHIELEYDTHQTYKKQFPNILIVVGVDVATENTDEIHSCPLLMGSEIIDGYSPAGTLCLSLPKNKRLSIKQSCVFESAYLLKGIEIFNDMIRELLPTSSNTKSTLIIFATNHDRKLDDDSVTIMQTAIKSIFPPNSYTLWGVVTTDKIFVSSDHDKSSQNITESKPRFVGLNLSGPNLESWSIVMSIGISKREFAERMTNFKDRIRLKKNSIGLITTFYGDDDDDNFRYELLKDLKKIFPEIPFLGAFSSDQDYYFGIDPTSDNESDILVSYETISIMVFTYE